YGPAAPTDLHSFPTRRSSDLACGTAKIAANITSPRRRRDAPVIPTLPPISKLSAVCPVTTPPAVRRPTLSNYNASLSRRDRRARSEEHTSELQSLAYLVCRLL